jgi:hypothetical protein
MAAVPVIVFESLREFRLRGQYAVGGPAFLGAPVVVAVASPRHSGRMDELGGHSTPESLSVKSPKTLASL